MAEATRRIAVVTGANKGIGFGVCKQLASNGIIVVLTARNEKRGLEAVEKLKEIGLSDHVLFHQLDVLDPTSISALQNFIQNQFGKLDILVNNAGVIGNILDGDALRSSLSSENRQPQIAHIDWSNLLTETYELAEECLNINYYGAKRTCEALIPLLQLSDSPNIVNVSSGAGRLTNIPDGWPKEVLTDAENLTEERLDEVLTEFLKDFKEGSLATKGWPPHLSAYIVSKATLNAYTRILAKRYQAFRINCVCPGFVKTDINHNTGTFTTDQGAENLVRLALLPKDGPSGLYFIRKEESPF
ncbi:(+)-neomenthol dehydrogenase-like [Mangifera indica]|uniref:(+)-neomenthol dehydrogenase-like n=1 Tax=Mangifera indica TaxID=29780 RepID=UPI001CFC2859|nr:(+)-neomenthol dehydrogenase-like [Mangifera indica]